MENVKSLRSSRSRSRTPMNLHSTATQISYSLSEEVFTNTPAMNTRSLSRQSNSRHKTSDYSSEEGSPENIKSGFQFFSSFNNIIGDSETKNENGVSSPKAHPAYKEYHEAGEYWNKYPKTDYTYSKRSPHRREMVNGSVGMPNMSRRSLHSYDERTQTHSPVNEVIFEKYRSSNLFSSSSKHNLKQRFEGYDGNDEVDKFVIEQRWWSTIWTNIVSILSFSRFFKSTTDESVYMTPYMHKSRQNIGVFAKLTSWMSKSMLWVMSYCYWLITSVLLLDCKLLCGRDGSVKTRNFNFMLLLLIPLILLAGWWLYLLPQEDFKTYTSNICETIMSVPNHLSDAYSGALSSITQIFTSPLPFLTDIINKTYNIVCSSIISLFNFIYDRIYYILNSISDLFTFVVHNSFAVLPATLNLVTDILSLISTYFMKFFSYAYDILIVMFSYLYVPYLP